MFSHPETNVATWNLPLGSSVADFGSGSGHHVLALALAVGEKGKVYAVDVQKDLLTKLKNQANEKGYHNVEVIWGDIEKIGGSKIGDGVLDAVLLSNIVFQVTERETLMQEAVRILKSGGSLCVIDWTDTFGGLGPQASHIVTKETMISLLENVGCTLDREFLPGEHHYGLICKKP